MFNIERYEAALYVDLNAYRESILKPRWKQYNRREREWFIYDLIHFRINHAIDTTTLHFYNRVDRRANFL